MTVGTFPGPFIFQGVVRIFKDCGNPSRISPGPFTFKVFQEVRGMWEPFQDFPGLFIFKDFSEFSRTVAFLKVLGSIPKWENNLLADFLEHPHPDMPDWQIKNTDTEY